MKSPIAMVLPGGAARGAYQVGALRFLVDLLPRELGIALPADLLCGTSVGAINAAMLAAAADEPARGVDRLCETWQSLRARELLRPASLCASTEGRPSRFGILDERRLMRVVRGGVPFARLHEQVQSGRVGALTVSATHIATGATRVFVESRSPPPAWRKDESIEIEAARIGPQHLLASSAIPLLFPPVAVDGELYCEGGLRQNVPLAPALRLGARRLLVITPHHAPARPSMVLAGERRRSVTNPLFLAGKMLNALLLDRVDADLDRIGQIDAILDAGRARFGDAFVEELNLAMPPGHHELRAIETVVLRPSESLGRIAAEFVESREATRRLGSVLGHALRALAEIESPHEADLLSYLLFDGEFAQRLIELGYRDARAAAARLVALYREP